VSRFVVLLRGVNVGKGNKVPMAEFRAALESLGHHHVRTLLNSGNAVFSSTSRSDSKLASVIAKAVEERFGVVTPVIVKSARNSKRSSRTTRSRLPSQSTLVSSWRSRWIPRDSKNYKACLPCFNLASASRSTNTRRTFTALAAFWKARLARPFLAAPGAASPLETGPRSSSSCPWLVKARPDPSLEWTAASTGFRPPCH
jgi:hypothetical protein